MKIMDDEAEEKIKTVKMMPNLEMIEDGAILTFDS